MIPPRRGATDIGYFDEENAFVAACAEASGTGNESLLAALAAKADEETAARRRARPKRDGARRADVSPRCSATLDGVDLSRVSGALNESGEPIAGYTNYGLHLLPLNGCIHHARERASSTGRDCEHLADVPAALKGCLRRPGVVD